MSNAHISDGTTQEHLDSGNVWTDAEPAPHTLLNARALCC